MLTRPLFSKLPKPIVTCILFNPTPEETIAMIRSAELDGAAAFCVDVRKLRPEYRNEEAFKRIIAASQKPFMFYFYRTSAENATAEDTDDARQLVLEQAINAGASIVDVMGDLYDPSPFELTRNLRAIEKQMKLIEHFHSLGAEVVMSSHMPQHRTPEEILEHLREQERRGADMVKIVSGVNSEEELIDAIRASMLLKREMHTPYIHLSNGSYALLHRYIGPILGGNLSFCQPQYDLYHQNGNQPLVKSLKAVLDNIVWRLPRGNDDVSSSKNV